jgi:O-antigen ligase/tetratricopeptide (TPR) repeat protein
MLVVLVAMNVLALCVLFDPFGQEAFELPKSLASRAIEWLTAAVLVVAVLRHGIDIVPRSRVWLFVAAYLAANAISAAFAANGYVALYGEFDRYLGLTFLLNMTVLAVAVAVAFRTPRDWEILGAAALAGWALAALYALVQLTGNDPFLWAADTRARPFSTFGNPDVYGQFLSLSFAVAFAVFLTSRDARRIQALSVAALTVLLVGVVATRGAILGIAATLALAPLVLAALGRMRRPSSRSIAAGLTAAAVVIVVLWLSPLGRRAEGSFAQGGQLEDRVVLWQGALREFSARPLVGWGPDSFAVGHPSSRLERSARFEGANSLASSAHDWILQIGATTGILGLATYLALIAPIAWVIVRRGLREQPAVAAPLLLALAAYLAHGLVTVGSASVDWLPWIVIGAAASYGTVIAREAPRRMSAAVTAASIAVVVVCLAGAATGAYAQLANHDAWFAAHNLSPERAAVAERAAEEATRLDASRASYWALLGDVRSIAGRPRDAASAHAEAAARAPYLPSYLAAVALDRAQQAAAGDLRDGGMDEAVRVAERAIAADPYEPSTHATLATIVLMLGQNDRAFAETARATALFPFAYDGLLAKTALRASDRAAARAAIVRVLSEHDTAALRVALGTMDLESGDRASAIIHARRALLLDPSNPDAKQLAQRLGI